MKRLLDDGFIGVRLGPSIAVPDLDFNVGKALIAEITLTFEEPFRRYFQVPFPAHFVVSLKVKVGKGAFPIDTQAKISYVPPPRKSFYRITEKRP